MVRHSDAHDKYYNFLCTATAALAGGNGPVAFRAQDNVGAFTQLLHFFITALSSNR